MIDDSGCVVGIVAYKLTGVIGGAQVESVNFAVKSYYLKPLLDKFDIEHEPGATRKMSKMKISKKYKDSVLPVWTEF